MARKKLLNLSETIQNLLQDCSAATGKSQQDLITESVRAHLISENEEVQSYTLSLFTNDNASITDNLSGLCGKYAAGVDSKAAYTNGSILISFIERFIENTPDYIHHLKNDANKSDPYIDSKLESLEDTLKNSPDSTVIHAMIGHPIDQSQFINLVRIIQDNVATLENMQITYRVLEVLLKSKSVHIDTPKDRLDYINMVKQLGEAWT